MVSGLDLRHHENTERFREALTFTESVTGFGAALIEKDYQCSVILHQLTAGIDHGLVFKGGTCLSKAHTEFYRLSEDLDFAVTTPLEATRSQRREAMGPLKDMIDRAVKLLPHLSVADPLTGARTSTQYKMRLCYDSAVSGQPDFIKLEISLREPFIDPSEQKPVRTILIDPLNGEPLVQPFPFNVMSFEESYAEKFRAALTRREPAIRDFYDIDYAVRAGKLRPLDTTLVQVVHQKLEVPGNEAIDISPEKRSLLQRQLKTQLKPVLRGSDFDEFELGRAFQIVVDVARSLGIKG